MQNYISLNKTKFYSLIRNFQDTNNNHVYMKRKINMYQEVRT